MFDQNELKTKPDLHKINNIKHEVVGRKEGSKEETMERKVEDVGLNILSQNVMCVGEHLHFPCSD